jgi:hypothetical protein
MANITITRPAGVLFAGGHQGCFSRCSKTASAALWDIGGGWSLEVTRQETGDALDGG